MIESERQRVILSAVQAKPVVTVAELVEMTGASEATIRRDIAALHVQKKLRRVRGGAESLAPIVFPGLAGRPFALKASQNLPQKRAIARAAVDLCEDGDAIIVNGGTTTFQMVYPLATRRLQVFTNSFPIAGHLLHNSRNTVLLSGGTVYREQEIVLSPFDNDVTRNFQARRMFMGAQGIGPLGVSEIDPLIIQAEEKLIGQAEELVVLVDASKFERRSSLIVRPLAKVSTVITDDRVEDRHVRMLQEAGVEVIVAPARAAEEKAS
ncbi:DeoR/GlpR family DNA-binding transcription regulator [Rubellimicrobium aerolatum]|uniref:DeoR/GlpR family DNA-binding transcription regulator n=1 Tax=Rubellimicrobium aerolatum TaxID=490979 RepID=A0ABW0SGQ1_9RHOB|nr:DeoR/GlpR family DNA-binding transcription regulator [Rubellimicrobium aerolatum]MBP1807542.1 DeoR family ulaG and ulaABCDEF operon transcriptional repressor [Rubellimicrobium aerolatum]